MASPLDRRLLELVPPVGRFIASAGITQALVTASLLVRGVLIGWVAARVVADGADLASVMWPLLWLALAVLAHGVISHLAQRRAAASVGEVIDSLRSSALAALGRQDPRTVQEKSAHWRTVLTDGLEQFRPYLSEFLPSLIAVVLATPASLAVIFWFDPLSGFIALVTLPLIPLFMILIGKLTAARTQRRLSVTASLGGQLADLLSGSLTLRALGVTKQPARQIRSTGAAQEAATMSVLRLAFLSSFALEFLATLSVALVAVSIGLRLVAGDLSLAAGLIVLIVIPEVYNPVRQVGTKFHAAADGLAATTEILDLIENDNREQAPARYVELIKSIDVEVEHLQVRGRDGHHPEDLSFTASPGQVTILHGPNGSGKSTVFLALLGLLPNASVSGVVRAPSLEHTSYLPAEPIITTGTVSDNLVLLGATTNRIADCATEVELDLPMDRALTYGGGGLSAGQAQRLALARTLALGNELPRLLVLDEPSAHLSPELVERLCQVLRQRCQRGDTVLVATHDQRLLTIADKVVEL
ncbi:ABC transporter ATP-binding protein/permease [Corynebacterium alimapuense]|uniref:ABC transporter n=1 Tax=Corynebacterium alimapuense TaxID=1576874 RepID=A0A3M8KBQ7_9CORY|nr:ATP-binding cassette domain-containing protein [Corynebacterium alimapuense]RNE49818.1 ABC transporter [Corynebacterium alimapuense]